MTYNVFGGTLNLAQSISHYSRTPSELLISVVINFLGIRACLTLRAVNMYRYVCLTASVLLSRISMAFKEQHVHTLFNQSKIFSYVITTYCLSPVCACAVGAREWSVSAQRISMCYC